MLVENVKKFYEVLSQDKEMQQKFIDLNQKYQGQPIDEAKAMSMIEQEGLPLAAQMGYSFTMDDLKAYGEEMKQAKMGCELSDEEMQAVTGSDGTQLGCAFIGFVDGGGASGFCFIFGYAEYNRQNATCFLQGFATFR